MSKSQISCAIDTTECAVVRLKTSGGTGYSLTACKTLPCCVGDLASGKGKRLLNKLGRYLNEWHRDDLVLCVEPGTYLPLPAYFPAHASQEECQKYCRVEAGYFLNRPEEYRCDLTGYCDNTNSGLHEKHLLLFYPDEPCRTASEHFSTNHRVVFSGSPQRALLHLSKLTGEPQAILRLETSSVLLTISRNGRIDQFTSHQVKSREETEYFALKMLADNPVCRETGVQVTGSKVDKAMMALIAKESSLRLSRLSIPRSISISNPQQFPLSSSSVVKAISTALMALSEENSKPIFSTDHHP